MRLSAPVGLLRRRLRTRARDRPRRGRAPRLSSRRSPSLPRASAVGRLLACAPPCGRWAATPCALLQVLNSGAGCGSHADFLRRRLKGELCARRSGFSSGAVSSTERLHRLRVFSVWPDEWPAARRAASGSHRPRGRRARKTRGRPADAAPLVPAPAPMRAPALLLPAARLPAVADQSTRNSQIDDFPHSVANIVSRRRQRNSSILSIMHVDVRARISWMSRRPGTNRRKS